MIDVPSEIADIECLYRRIHPTFIKSDGSVSSQAFTDNEMSVDRGQYRSIEQSLLNHSGYGLAGFFAKDARNFGQEVISEKELLNLAHALVVGKKTKSIARKLAKSSIWVCPITKNQEN